MVTWLSDCPVSVMGSYPPQVQRWDRDEHPGNAQLIVFSQLYLYLYLCITLTGSPLSNKDSLTLVSSTRETVWYATWMSYKNCLQHNKLEFNIKFWEKYTYKVMSCSHIAALLNCIHILLSPRHWRLLPSLRHPHDRWLRRVVLRDTLPYNSIAMLSESE